MTLGAALIKTENLPAIRERISEIKAIVGKEDLHCKNLRHFQKVIYAKEVQKLPVMLFGAMSLKTTLGWYNQEISGDSKLYYNKCAQLLLECVGQFMKANKLERHQLDIVFEEGNFAYEKLKNLIRVCQDTPIARTDKQLERIKLLRYISADNILATPKSEEPLLQLSDLVAHSLYKCVDKPRSCYELTEPRYFNELKSKFYHNTESGQIIGYGLKVIHALKQLNLDSDISKLFQNASAIA